MPSGYTYKIIDEGGTTFKEFALDCAKAFGACIELRDEPADTPIPDAFKVSPWRLEAIEEAQEELLNFEGLESTYLEEIEARKQRNEEYNKEKALNRQKYEQMLEKAKEWEPPSTEHIHLKDFMVDQIKQSIEWDCREVVDAEPETYEAWRECKLNVLEDSIEYHKKEYEEEVKRTEERNLWIKQLRESLKESA